MITPVQLPSSVSKYSRTIALLLCLFLGFIGAHRFYVRKIGSAFGMILLTMFFGCGLFWAAMDFLEILSGVFTDGSGHHVTSWKGGSRSQDQLDFSDDVITDFDQPRMGRRQVKDPVCYNCGSLIEGEESYCRSCGFELSGEI